MSLPPILLVEDDPSDVELAAAAIAAAGIRNPVTVARDGSEALEYLNRRGQHRGRAAGNPCLVLLDLKLPKVDGLEVLAILKGDRALRPIPAVVLTSSQETSDKLAAAELGVDAYVVKPVGLPALITTMRELAAYAGIATERAR
jgi:CheY-like chemotaxis protein